MKCKCMETEDQLRMNRLTYLGYISIAENPETFGKLQPA